MPTAIIADDERLMRDQLRSRLEQVWPELQILDEAKNGEEAVQLVETLQPDFAFLDIRMPAKTGLEAAKEIGNKAHIVFITAYDQYAIEAFDHGAVDYVLKPADVERLTRTVERLKTRLHSQAEPNDMSNMLAQLAKQMGIGKQSYLQWIQASIGQELRLIPVEEILFFQSDEKYTRVQTASYEALIRKPVRDLAEELDPALFWQIHRATLVNAKAISGVVRDMRGRHLVQVKGLTEKLEVSRSFVHLFKQM
ncbi:LytTR family DNA-binding domain-containing protein [Undibacterium sp. RTI2.1]|uniref:LytR/AlgR family response regulator transcription factor n=1 Tax=unclassified Undibacterium TaxID=2630295 RepID=UPI002AB4EE48|nr:MULTISPECIES: LytTR family DNA-binding domain-containing protein [unclassified Undibacterium]MDY7537498.1 LytTR family DNA-binding domain-containing protein [Undibacterium sp. 5I1]MEB0031771.1 LytTR family DNA-binding domain-containing protein [Undibacterium sp. RTI2.1]MEB0117800.1 LytTR family DNA-binding domain-containing protein [Undibacterium sp. RTI2.2]MEB0230921.1 LytTR family DNA-binding domain-containing protein [Undibacterium sp. 10I3]MEB0258240.1 LytTR family DNA-binding domain-co